MASYTPCSSLNNVSKTKENGLLFLPIPVAARSKAWAGDSSLAGVSGSNPAGGMSFVSYQVEFLRRAYQLSRGVLPIVVCLSVIARPPYEGACDPLRAVAQWGREGVGACKSLLRLGESIFMQKCWIFSFYFISTRISECQYVYTVFCKELLTVTAEKATKHSAANKKKNIPPSEGFSDFSSSWIYLQE
jgi:hypothetical protein